MTLSPETQEVWGRLVWAKCLGIPLGDGNYTGCTAPEPPADCPICGGKGLRWPQLSRKCGVCFDPSHADPDCVCEGRGRLAVEPTERVLMDLARTEDFYLALDSGGHATVCDERSPYQRPDVDVDCPNDPLSAGILALAEALGVEEVPDAKSKP